MQERPAAAGQRRRHVPRTPYTPSSSSDVASGEPAAARRARRVDAVVLLGPAVGANRSIAARVGAPVTCRTRNLLPARAPPDGTTVVTRTPRRNRRRNHALSDDLERRRHAAARAATLFAGRGAAGRRNGPGARGRRR